MSISQTITGEKHSFETNAYLFRKMSDWRQAMEVFKPKNKPYEKNKTDVLRFEISSDKMTFLLSNHQICVTDIRCLDSKSKQCLKKLCLQTCLHDNSKTVTYQKEYDD